MEFLSCSTESLLACCLKSFIEHGYLYLAEIRGFGVNVFRFFFGHLQYRLFGNDSFLNFTMVCETLSLKTLQGSQCWGEKRTFAEIVFTGFAKLLR